MSNMSDIEKLKKIVSEKTMLEKKIEMLSIYEIEDIGDIIAKLMTRYEEVEYECKKSSHYFHDSDYSIRPVVRESGVLSGCELGFVSNMKFKKLQFDYGEKPICFLPPSGYLDVVNDSLSDKSSYYTYIDYIQKFIDYLYDTKSRENITKFSKERIEVLLNEFLENTKEEQYFHKKEHIKKEMKRKEREQIYGHERLYKVDRNSVFNAISYIVNNCSDDMNAVQQKYSEWERTGGWSTLIVYHKLSIKSDIDSRIFIAEVDRDWCYPDEEIGGVIVDYGKQTYIDYFELKNSLYPILNKNPYCTEFMKLIEDRFNDTKILTAIDVEELLNLVKNIRKTKVKKL